MTQNLLLIDFRSTSLQAKSFDVECSIFKIPVEPVKLPISKKSEMWCILFAFVDGIAQFAGRIA